MADAPRWLLYGAYGHTGERIAREAARRGMQPLLAGRNPQKLGRLAAELRLDSRAFSLSDAKHLDNVLGDLDAVLHCAGPFSRTATPMIAACLRQGVHYLDITGEIDVIEYAARCNDEAQQRGVVLMPAVGFDVVPSDCLAVRVASAVEQPDRLEMAFTGTGSLSRGTARTMAEAFPRGCKIRRNGQIVTVPWGQLVRDVPFADRRRRCTAVPWGDVASAWYSTGIPNVEVYLAAPERQIRAQRRLRPLLPLLRLLPRDLLAEAVRRVMRPGQDKDSSEPRGAFWARASNPQGDFAEATLSTPEGYHLTVLTALGALHEVLSGNVDPGFHTPGEAFGGEFIERFAGCEFRWGKARRRS